MIHEKKYRLGTVSKNILLESIYRFQGANLSLSSEQIEVYSNLVDVLLL